MASDINKRKAEHIKLCLTDQVTGEGISSGLDAVRLVHNALPEIDFDNISLETTFLGKPIKTPFLISSMTGGAELAGDINQHLATAAEEHGWVFALGSTRALIENESFRESFRIRKYAPTIPVVANLGAVQLNEGFTVSECKQIIDITGADALVLHLNSIQEIIQTDGDTNFHQLLPKIERLVKELDVPVGVKEVGWGIDGVTAKRLDNIGIQFIDVAGAGGTSWSQVEKLRSQDRIKKQAAEAFVDWGISTVESLLSVKENVSRASVFASGGMHTGVDACKTIALGASQVGFARSILKEATTSAEAVSEIMQIRELELKMAMFGLGVSSIEALQQTDRVVLT
ncbi:isopentenyl-diphosphate delta-isomerase [Pelagirhabdus alkalitolerans]|uniref:Isopentenyl-diphosphate delta-isomerase n=1 Tax=Pelagirhabdus alkalitolerans TaxID=1612202 RepID=A0A1G6JMS0_9BACI|nr:type 2 isopentenyl-diphosphate Delta-isomerase [Pelagirhabdus alkalitolerans]SDC20030.1 isopentenyl-diphosphate delta-isomerase [Pelagirhabdus alkalitolerans]